MAISGETNLTVRQSRGGDLLFLAAVAVVAFRFGKSAGAKSHTALSVGAIVGSYLGLRAMDKVFGELLRDRQKESAP